MDGVSYGANDWNGEFHEVNYLNSVFNGIMVGMIYSMKLMFRMVFSMGLMI